MRTKEQNILGLTMLCAALIGGGAACGAQSNSAGSKMVTRTMSLGVVPALAGGGTPLVSADNRHVAYPVMRAGKWSVSLDGKVGQPYSKVSGLVFSPDGMRLAFVARKAFKRETVVVDGEEGKEYGFVDPQSLTFSPDSRRVAFIAGPSDSRKQFVVLDGNGGPAFDGMCGGGPGQPLLFFSPDSRRLAYGAGNKGDEGHGAYCVIIEGGERRTYPLKKGQAPLVCGFSADGEGLAWMEDFGGKRQMVIDGAAGKEYDEINARIPFSPSGKRTAYFAQRGGKWVVVVDGQEGPEFEGLGDCPPTFSGDGRRLAYIAIRANKYFVVLDGQESKEYDGVSLHSLRFSRDGKHFAYVAVRDRKHFVVRDGQEGKAYDGGLDTIFFSPDDRHLAYAVETGAHTRWVLDDRECREYDSMANNWACFSPDSKHLAYGAIRASKVVLVVDEQELGEYYGNLGTLSFDGAGLLRGVASRMDEKFDLEIVRLEVEMLPR